MALIIWPLQQLQESPADQISKVIVTAFLSALATAFGQALWTNLTTGKNRLRW